MVGLAQRSYVFKEAEDLSVARMWGDDGWEWAGGAGPRFRVVRQGGIGREGER